MIKRGVAAAVGVILWAGSASGQEQPVPKMIDGDYADLTKALENFSASKWDPVKKNASADEVRSQLERSGWDTGTVLENLEGGTRFDLYQKAIAPGQVGYMAIPKAGRDAEPATFLPTNPTDVVLAGAGMPWSSRTFSADEVRAELVRGIETGIDTFCGMNTKPSTVTMTVSAFGFVDVEATWDTSEVCKPGQQ